MIPLLLSLWRELLLNNALKKQKYVHFIALSYETDFLANFFFTDQSLEEVPGVPCWDGNCG